MLTLIIRLLSQVCFIQIEFFESIRSIHVNHADVACNEIDNTPTFYKLRRIGEATICFLFSDLLIEGGVTQRSTVLPPDQGDL